MKRYCLFVFLCLLFCGTNSVKVYGESGTTGSLSWNYTSSTLTISGTGAMPDYAASTNAPWQAYSPSKVIIGDGVTHIGKYAFASSNVKASLAYVEIGKGVQSFGENAFNGCTKIAEIHTAKTPDEWAQIEFQGESPRTAHPFGASTATARKFFFNGKNTETNILVFTPNITEIKAYAFYNWKSSSAAEISIPGTVNKIGIYAFSYFTTGGCNIKSVAIDRETMPTCDDATKTFSFNTDSYLYIPKGSKSSYSAWYNGTGGSGAKYLGYNDAIRYAESGGGYTCYLSGSCTCTSGAIDWELDPATGTLTLTGNGELQEFSNSTKYPWYRFRRLVYKVVIKGADEKTITSIKDAIKWCYYLTAIDIQQSQLPEMTEPEKTEILENFFEDVELTIPLSEIGEAIHMPESSPWNKLVQNIEVSEPWVISETDTKNEENAANCAQLSKPIAEVNMVRALSNGYYNTFCSPIPFTAAQVSAIFGEGTLVSTLTGSSYNKEENALTLEFTEPSLTAIEAGKPYIIKPSKVAAEQSLAFTNVDPTSIVAAPIATETDYIDFIGIYSPYTPSNIDNLLFLVANNALAWVDPNNVGSLKGMRAYFLLKDLTQENIVGCPTRISFGRNMPTDIRTREMKAPAASKQMHNGQMIIFRNGKKYNLQGVTINK